MQGRSRQKKPFEIAPEIQHLANIEELGEFRKVYTIKKSNTQIFGVGILSIFIGIMWILIWALAAFSAPKYLSRLLWAIPGFIFLLAGFYVIFSRRLYSRWNIYLWQYGFLYERGQKLQVFRWNRISSLQNVSSLFCYVHRQDGYKLTLSAAFPELEELVDVLYTEFVRHFGSPELLIPHSHNTITCTSVKLDQKGIGAGQEVLSWQEIQEFTTNKGTVTIVKKEE